MIDTLPVTASRVFYQYGFATMEPDSTGNWQLDCRDRTGRVIEPGLPTGFEWPAVPAFPSRNSCNQGNGDSRSASRRTGL
jgi:hypothetical protein